MSLRTSSPHDWALLPDQPWISIVPGPPATWRAVLPTLRRVGETFALSLRADDRWGNPSHLVRGRFCLKADAPVDGLPEAFAWPTGERRHRLEGLSAASGDLVIALFDAAGSELATSNPLRIATELGCLPFWADMHGQSEETIGTNSARRLAEYARDLAFVDAMCHQGNDFQITEAFWNDLNDLTREFDQPGRFIFFPGYKWSGNTALGGDRNVVLKREGCTLHRSSQRRSRTFRTRTWIPWTSKRCTPYSAWKATSSACRMSAAATPICSTRTTRRLKGASRCIRTGAPSTGCSKTPSLSEGASALPRNSDGHKGRQGASHPGASLFGAYGGLTCYLAKDLSRDALWDAMLWRRQYATTGGCRAHLDARVRLIVPAALHRDDPALGGAPVSRVTEAGLGAILTHVADTEVEFDVEVLAGAPIERIENSQPLRAAGSLASLCPDGAWSPYSCAVGGSRVSRPWAGDNVAGHSCIVRQQLGRHPCSQSLQSRSPLRSDAAGARLRRRHHRWLHGC